MKYLTTILEVDSVKYEIHCIDLNLNYLIVFNE